MPRASSRAGTDRTARRFEIDLQSRPIASHLRLCARDDGGLVQRDHAQSERTRVHMTARKAPVLTILPTIAFPEACVVKYIAALSSRAVPLVTDSAAPHGKSPLAVTAAVALDAQMRALASRNWKSYYYRLLGLLPPPPGPCAGGSGFALGHRQRPRCFRIAIGGFAGISR